MAAGWDLRPNRSSSLTYSTALPLLQDFEMFGFAIAGAWIWQPRYYDFNADIGSIRFT